MIERNKQILVLKDEVSIILDQNVPNPFAEETDIHYTLPPAVKNAFLFVYDKSGTIFKKVELQERGAATIHIYAADLSNGLYTYSLLVDGKVVETKTMVKTK